MAYMYICKSNKIHYSHKPLHCQIHNELPSSVRQTMFLASLLREITLQGEHQLIEKEVEQEQYANVLTHAVCYNIALYCLDIGKTGTSCENG